MRRNSWVRGGLIAVSIAALAGCGSTVQLGAGQTTSGLSSGLSGDGTSLTNPSGVTATSIAGGDTSVGASTSGSTTGTTTSGGTDTSASGDSSGSSDITGSPIDGIPRSGYGWDAKYIYIGVPTANDSAAAFKAAGANFDNGDINADYKAVAADINAHGGLFGRQVMPSFYDVHTADALANPAAVAQAICTHFTEDRPVIAVVNGAPQFDAVPNFHTCLEKKHVTLLSQTNTLFSDSDYKTLGPNMYTLLSMSTNILIPTFIDALKREGYFSGWNTGSGKPSTLPAKIGIVMQDDPQGHYVYNLMVTALKANGLSVAAKYFYSSNSHTDGSSEVLQFKAAGVTHVLNLPPVEADMGLFEENAQQQGYHPRYALSSFNLPASLETNASLAPPKQQVGSIGIGWQSLDDTDAAHDPGPNPGDKRCMSALGKGGITFDSSHRRAKFVAQAICDALYLLHDASIAGKGLTASALFTGMPIAGNGFASAVTFGGALSKTNQGLPGFYRDEAYDESCSCFKYSGPNRLFTR
jgi:hypothetical protein